MSDYSEQEIDFRPYVEAVLSRWHWILGLGLLAGVLAYTASVFLLSPIYETTALVSIIEPRQRVQFDPRIVTVEENQPLRAYPEIAVSDEFLSSLQSNLPIAATYTLQHLRSMLRASPGSDPSLLNLSVRNTDPETASDIANGWAELFVFWANNTYGDSSIELLLFFEKRLEEAAAELQVAEDALIDYQDQNRTAILENELLALHQTHANLLAKEKEIEILSQDIESLLASAQDDIVNDHVAVLILKLRAFGGSGSDGNMILPYQLQLNTDILPAENGANPAQQVMNLQAILAIQAEQTAVAIAGIEPQILSVQKEAQAARTTESLLQRNIELAGDTHTALARTVEEKRITSQDSNAGVRLVSRSITPTAPIGPRKTLNALAAAAGTIFLATLTILIIHWWRSNEVFLQPPSGTDDGADDSLADAGRQI